MTAKAAPTQIETATASEVAESRLDRLSDLLSPIVVKEVRQMVQGREFNYSLTLSVIVGLLVAFATVITASSNVGDSGGTVFASLTSCLLIVGLIVSPLGAFNALRNERMERTLDLVTVTTMSARRIVIGKLMAQAVKLLTLFAALAPFIAMSFVLGGIDFLTIALSLSTLFLMSLWACAAALFLSSLSRSRAVSSLIFGAMILFLLFIFGTGSLGFILSRGAFYGPRMGMGPLSFLFPFSRLTGSELWWTLAGYGSFFLVSITNLILLAENRLLQPAEDRSTALRIGFLLQFLLIIAGSIYTAYGATPYGTSYPAGLTPSGTRSLSDAADLLGVLGGIHLAVVAIFSVTEEMIPSRRIRHQIQAAAGWRKYLWVFRPGAARGAIYVLMQMALLFGIGLTYLSSASMEFNWLVAICGYICFYTGLPVILMQILKPGRFKPIHRRIAVVLLVTVAALLPDFIVYLATGDFGGLYSSRHVLNPFRTLSNWDNTTSWHFLAMGLCAAGFIFYLGLISIGRRELPANEAAN